MIYLFILEYSQISKYMTVNYINSYKVHSFYSLPDMCVHDSKPDTVVLTISNNIFFSNISIFIVSSLGVPKKNKNKNPGKYSKLTHFETWKHISNFQKMLIRLSKQVSDTHTECSEKESSCDVNPSICPWATLVSIRSEIVLSAPPQTLLT